MNPVLKRALPRWVGMSARLLFDGVDVRDVAAALRPEIERDLQGLTEAEQVEIGEQTRLVMRLFRDAMLAACAQPHGG